MNKHWIHLLIIAVMISTSGCNDRLDLEDAAFPLLAGFDLDEKNNLHTYVALPVFSSSAQKKTYKLDVTAQTLGQTRQQSDAHWPAVFQGRKVLVMLVSKRLVEHDDWFRILDVFSRDAKNPLTCRLIMYDGPLSEIIYLNQKDEPFLPLLLRGMVDTKSERSETVKTTFQDMHRLRFEKGKTPAIAEVQLDHEIRLSGSALLDHQGKYTDSLNAQETILMQILQNKANKPVSLSLTIPGHPKRGPLNTNKLSFNTNKTNAQIKTYFHDDRFRFDLAIQFSVVLTERLFPYDVKNNSAELEKAIAEQLKKQIERLISKFQSHHIDPIGLGIYAQAFAYKPYKKVEDQWGQALSQAVINVTVKVRIESMGVVK
ncbi:germination protein, Ger(x)C family [Paenibacillus sp. 1_12]|uniref:Ger(x)C family spore germination protein n=1 Tax=Paenibacillus sp. 1_12 TaxID=1566278 RepID=UPI0008F2BB28|nr:Ger(x)C family spore germination protein [Paenibacillus sp. 1_12]SFM28797.1 germination protein, Ger(x)C family [Paenibacillus sp. 1_12]